MKTEIMFADVRPYIMIWTGFVIMFLLTMIVYFRHFQKQHPEIFQPDTTADNKQRIAQKNELRRQYHNQSMLSISVVFVWIIGIVVICFDFDYSAISNQGWFLLGFAVIVILWVLSMTQQKKQK